MIQPCNPLDLKPSTVLKGHKGPIYIAKFNSDG